MSPVVTDWFETYPVVKPDAVKAVKLTPSNLESVAGHILETAGGRVELAEGEIRFGSTPLRSVRAGDWVIEEYNYVSERVEYRRATMVDHQRYDLR